MQKHIFWIALAALTLSLITITIIIMDIWSISVIDSNTFISALIGIMTLVFTLFIGYQIYNAIIAQEKMELLRREIEGKLKDVDALRSEVSALTNEFVQGGYLLQARIEFTGPNKGYGAFIKMLKAILAALDVDNRQEGYSWLLKELKEYMLSINNTYPFTGTPQEVLLIVTNYKELYKADDEAIRRHENYYLIRDGYEPLMSDFNKRLDGIAQMKAMSNSEVGEEAN